ncbi:hypothetical protein C0Q70_06002 [Pomacea canaliculata]|uniref:Uncharacterized protein n=1 Tax=Pomacea canaliculata TaxID=400727 RepID=A0A2T7PMT5_POMCA|nr:hypothetical protein C0Q70_06002 [Pomacea canaliculata]
MPLARSSEVRSKPCRAGEVVCLPGHLPHALLVLAAAPQCLRSHLDRASVVYKEEWAKTLGLLEMPPEGR